MAKANGVIEASQATIQTATVEVKVIKIGKRQLTLSVFRQLPERQVIDAELLALRGEPWGRVNYRWQFDRGPYEQMVPDSVQVVWQASGVLFRCHVTRWFAYSQEAQPWQQEAHERLRGMPKEERKAFRRCWEEIYDRLAALDQLFIAV
jgi:hypothetical protein